MIRLAHISDIHLSERVYFESTKRVLVEFVEHVEAAAKTSEPFDLVAIPGDIADPRRAPARATPAERNYFGTIVARLARVCPIVAVRGNHDAVGDWSFLNSMRTEHPVIWIDEGFDSFEVPGLAGVMVHAVPWQSPAAWQRMANGLSVEPGEDPVELAMRAAFEGIADHVRADEAMIHIGIGHMAVAGGKLPSGQELVGSELEVPWHMLALARCHYFALGHLHSAQKVKGSPSYYAGSPNRLNFGEAGKPCSFYDVVVEHDEVHAQAVLLEQANRLHTVDATALVTTTGEVDLDVNFDNLDVLYGVKAGDQVRVRVRIPEGLSVEDLIAQLVQHVEGLGAVAHLERIPLTELRAREGADEIANAPTVAQKVEAYLAQRDVEPNQRGRVLARFDRLQERSK